MTAATETQATSISEINTAIGYLDQMTQQNAAMVEQSSAAAASLATEANTMSDLVSNSDCRDDHMLAEAMAAPPGRTTDETGTPPFFRSQRATTMSKDLKLPERLDNATAGHLAGELSRLRGQPAKLDGSAVRFGGALGLQVLVAARRQWQADGQGFKVAPTSDALRNACRVLGIDPDEIGAASDSETEDEA
ncbi:MAG: STAS domain-containing protein [Paracoccaceae bacterium]